MGQHGRPAEPLPRRLAPSLARLPVPPYPPPLLRSASPSRRQTPASGDRGGRNEAWTAEGEGRPAMTSLAATAAETAASPSPALSPSPSGKTRRRRARGNPMQQKRGGGSRSGGRWTEKGTLSDDLTASQYPFLPGEKSRGEEGEGEMLPVATPEQGAGQERAVKSACAHAPVNTSSCPRERRGDWSAGPRWVSRAGCWPFYGHARTERSAREL